MNRLIFLIFFCLMVIPKITAQNWYPIGAEWYYNWQVLLDYPAHGYTQYTVDKDTIIASENAKKIISRSYNFNNGNISSSSVYYLWEDNSIVYQWTGSEYRMMYDLTLEKGDTFDIKASLQEGCDSTSAIIVDSVGYRVIDGLNLKVQHFSYTAYFNDDHHELYSDSIVERIGRIQEFIYKPTCGWDVVPWETLLLRCYQDSEFSFKADWWTNYTPNAPCDTLIDGYTRIAQYENELLVFPNPGNDFIYVKSSNSIIKEISLFNSLGIQLIHFTPFDYFVGIEINSLPVGIYHLIISTLDNTDSISIIKK